jgi:hypothetical protein
MKPTRIASLVLVAGAAVAFAACGDGPTASDNASIYDDAAVTLDVAASAGDAAAILVGTMAGNDSTAAANGSGSETINGVTVTRTRACYDASNAVVANCLPFSSVRMIATSASISGSRTSTRTTAGGGTTTWTGNVHRTSADTTKRNFTDNIETSRSHTALAISHDTTTFTDATFTRSVAENARDSVKNVTFTLPHASNPWPSSGSIVRVDSVHVTVAKGSLSVSRDIVRTVEIDFPADAQGNVTLKVNAKTCLLNLVTHAVTNCQ